MRHFRHEQVTTWTDDGVEHCLGLLWDEGNSSRGLGFEATPDISYKNVDLPVTVNCELCMILEPSFASCGFDLCLSLERSLAPPLQSRALLDPLEPAGANGGDSDSGCQ
jgi:hypothetical protein